MCPQNGGFILSIHQDTPIVYVEHWVSTNHANARWIQQNNHKKTLSSPSEYTNATPLHSNTAFQVSLCSGMLKYHATALIFQSSPHDSLAFSNTAMVQVWSMNAECGAFSSLPHAPVFTLEAVGGSLQASAASQKAQTRSAETQPAIGSVFTCPFSPSPSLPLNTVHAIPHRITVKGAQPWTMLANYCLLSARRKA